MSAAGTRFLRQSCKSHQPEDASRSVCAQYLAGYKLANQSLHGGMRSHAGDRVAAKLWSFIFSTVFAARYSEALKEEASCAQLPAPGFPICRGLLYLQGGA